MWFSRQIFALSSHQELMSMCFLQPIIHQSSCSYSFWTLQTKRVSPLQWSYQWSLQSTLNSENLKVCMSLSDCLITFSIFLWCFSDNPRVSWQVSNMTGAHIFETYNLEGGSKKNRLKKIQRVVTFMGCSGFLLIMASFMEMYSAPQEIERNSAAARHSWARQHAWLVGCFLIYFHFLWGKLSTRTVYRVTIQNQLRKWKYSVCCLGVAFLIWQIYLPNCIHNISGVQSFVVTWYK